MLYPNVSLPELVAEIKAAAKLRSAAGKQRYLELYGFYVKVTTARCAESVAKRGRIPFPGEDPNGPLAYLNRKGA